MVVVRVVWYLLGPLEPYGALSFLLGVAQLIGCHAWPSWVVGCSFSQKNGDADMEEQADGASIQECHVSG